MFLLIASASCAMVTQLALVMGGIRWVFARNRRITCLEELIIHFAGKVRRVTQALEDVQIAY